MLLIDEGELSCGTQQETLEDTGAAIHPASHLHTPKLHTLHSVVIFLLSYSFLKWQSALEKEDAELCSELCFFFFVSQQYTHRLQPI